MSDQEEVLRGGQVNPAVVRIGDTVRRTPTAATSAVHDLLRHLEAKGFDGAPRVLGFDDQGREVLSYVEGVVAHDESWPEVLHSDDGLVAVVRLLERFHDAVADHRPPGLAPEEIVCHGDPGPWNIVWRGDEPVALIDWDFALHASPLYDLSYVAFEMVPLRDDDRCRAMGFTDIPDRARRLRLVCDTYGRGASPEKLLDLAEGHQLADIDEIEHDGSRGVEPFKTFFEQGLADEARAMLQWLRLHRELLLG
ncbi:MAG TPA: phosphotransferase [Acidimicrobiales bacterium]|nr:phosphotransferase [Acidimicrobiales bacterium]